MNDSSHDASRDATPGPSTDDWTLLTRRLGIDPGRIEAEGPRRGPLAGPSDETPLEKTIRLSAQLEQLAAEIGSVRSATYRAQLWQQWEAMFRNRPEHRAWRERVGPAAGDDASPLA